MIPARSTIRPPRTGAVRAARLALALGTLALLPACGTLDSLGITSPSVPSYSEGKAPAPETLSSLSQADPQALFRIARAAETNGDWAAAARVYERLAQTEPNRIDVHLGMGRSMLGAGDLKRAEASFRRAASFEPGREEVMAGLARTYLQMRRPTDAITYFDAASRAAPQVSGYQSGKGVALDMMSRHAEAQQAYRAALKIKPDDVAAANNLGLSLALSGKADEAVAVLSRLVLEPGATARVRQNLALAYGMRGDEAAARRTAVADLDPSAADGNVAFYRAARTLPY